MPSSHEPKTTHFFDAGMAHLVPQKATACQAEEPFPIVGEALESLRQFLGASAGWVCLHDAGAGLTFPVRRGTIPESWLRLQQARACVWGFAVREGPTLLNDLKPWPTLGEPPSRNLLSCPLRRGETIFGHVALVNKPQGFAAPDAAVLEGMAHHMTRLLDRLQAGPAPAVELSPGWRRILDQVGRGILILDESGTLIYANAIWLDWSGFSAEELLGRQAPFPFWLSQHALVRAMSAAPSGTLPFRRQDDSLLWCQVETVTEGCDGRRLTVAFLQRTPEPVSSPREAERPAVARPIVERYSPLPLSYPTPSWLALLLEADGTTDGWGPRWEKLTGLSSQDLEGSRSDLVLDWLFPQQTDRERVADCLLQPDPTGCQFILELATPAGSRPLLCTFLLVPPIESAGAKKRRWLLLVGEPELFAGPGTPSRGFVRQFALGLHKYLLRQLQGIDELTRLALERGDPASETTDRLRNPFPLPRYGRTAGRPGGSRTGDGWRAQRPSAGRFGPGIFG